MNNLPKAMSEKLSFFENGAKSWVLWVNMLLTAILLPMSGYLGAKIWDKLDKNSEQLIRLEERQKIVMEQIPLITLRLDKLDRKPEK